MACAFFFLLELRLSPTDGSHSRSLLPTTFLPLRILSLTSLIGIMSSFVLLAVLITDGVVKHDAPGSLVQVMPTSLWPRWKRFPLSFGLLMSGVSDHSIFFHLCAASDRCMDSCKWIFRSLS